MSIKEKLYFAFVLLALFFVNESSGFKKHSPAEHLQHPICVVGAGFAGLGVGTALRNKGYNVEIFEANNRVGGKAETFRQSDQILIEKCPLFIKNSSELILGIIQQYGLTLRFFDQEDRAGFDSTTGFVSELPPLTPEVIAAIQDGLRRFQAYSDQYVHDLDFGYLTTNPNLFESLEDWLVARNLTILHPLFVPLVTVQGYGDLRDVPALYILKEFANIVTSTEGFLTVNEGLDVLVKKMAEPLKVFLNHKADKIIRVNDDIQYISFNVRTRNYALKRCSKVILAFPPLLDTLKDVIIDMTQEERAVLAQVKVQRYTAGGHHIPSLNHTVYYEAFTQVNNKTVFLPTPVGNGEPVGLVLQSTRKLQNVYSSYSFERGSSSTAGRPNQLKAFRSKLNAFLPKVSPNVTTYFLHATEYFPHVTTASLQAGFYKKFDDIQGNRGLYFATSLLTFETMEKTLEMASSLVEKYFDTQ